MDCQGRVRREDSEIAVPIDRVIIETALTGNGNKYYQHHTTPHLASERNKHS